MNRLAIWALAMLSVSGCANLTTIGRKTELPDSGLAIHLDEQQRLVYSNKDGVVCAEPSPDAIQATAAALGSSLSIPTKGAAALSQALQQSTGSNGLRTQSITLMRDAMYRICEASHNKKLGDRDLVQLLERSQDMTLGVLAIEQLTGAVAAKQIILSGSANSSASSNIADTQAQLDNAKSIEQQKKQAMDDAQKQLNADSTKLAADQAVTPADAATTTEINSLAAKKPAEEAALTSATADYKTAQTAREAIEKNFNAAVSASNANVAGNGQFDGGGATKNIDKDTAEKIATAVTTIVTTIVQKGHLTDTCINFLSDYSKLTTSTTEEKKSTTTTTSKTIQTLQTTNGADTFALCKLIIEADIESNKIFNQERAAALKAAAERAAAANITPVQLVSDGPIYPVYLLQAKPLAGSKTDDKKAVK